MIQLAEDLEYLDSYQVVLDPKYRKVFIEVASNQRIDIAVVDSEQLEEFEESDTGEDVKIDWFEKKRTLDLEFEFPGDRKKRYLLFWNSNDEDDAVVAYKITPVS